MKNYVVWTNCEIHSNRSEFGLGIPRAADYDKMFEVSLASAKHFLAGTWTHIVWTEPAESRVAMFKSNWQRIWDLWHAEPCNILYLDSDTVFVKPVTMFDRFEEFRLFNWSQPPSTALFANNFNAGVRYYPHSMSADIWRIGSDMAANWSLDIWDQEQIIFNQMFWAQNLPWSDAHRPTLNWQQPVNCNLQQMVEFNRTPFESAEIIHYHGTRGCERAAQFAQLMAREAGIPL